MRFTKQDIYLIARPELQSHEIMRYLRAVDGLDWWKRVANSSIDDAEVLTEFMGRLCYRSWSEGLNPNVTRVRKDSAEYLRNILFVGHGSVLEHATFSWVLKDVSRVLTHELVRHRVGTAFSQESLRFVRLTDVPFWMPEWFESEHPDIMEEAYELLEQMENLQHRMGQAFHLDDEGVPFAEKKHKTSFMRRFAPIGTTTTIGVSMNVRAMRHIIEMRTDAHAEEEIRLVFDLMAERIRDELPLLFGDYEKQPDGSWKSPYRKV